MFTEMFTKDLVKLKNKQTEMNNILEDINSRITEAKKRISDLEDRMVEAYTEKLNIEKKKVKRKEDSSGMTLNAHSQYRGSRGRREKGLKKICEDIIPEHFPNIGKEIVN